jgi:hypothetical protein
MMGLYHMTILTLVRKRNVLTEEYGKVCFSGSKVSFHGLTCVFVKYLQRGITTNDKRIVKPEHGMDFIKTLKETFADDILTVTEQSVT